ncbi:MAG: hypothetical protein ABR574_07865 [Cryomorphaceae bacterium]|nr:hypothetical protein [Flavobacteriales bacterium]
MKKVFYLGFLIVMGLSPILSSCSDDDDDNGPSGNGGGDDQPEYVNFTFDGNDYAATTLSVSSSESSIEITGSDESENMEVLVACLTSITEGTHTTSSTLGIAVVIGIDGWFAGESCTVMIEEHDTANRYIRGTASGTLSDLFGTNSKPLNSMEFAFSY